MSDFSVILTIVCVYFAVVLAIGLAAGRRNASTAEDYFLAGRSVKTVVLFMALVGTNISPFVLMGIPGLAYHRGIGVFGQNASIIVLGIPLSIYLIGLPSWRRARALGAVTPAELYAKHFEARWFGWLVFGVYFVFTVPYMVTAVSGVGIAVDTFSGGAVSFEAAAAGILLVTLLYTGFGGMRGTMWTNVLQGSIFLVFSVVAFFLIADVRGGVAPTMREVVSAHPELMDVPNEGPFRIGPWASWGLGISLCVIAFPHMLVRIFAAQDEESLKNACRLYPAAMVMLWIPCVLFGVWGTLDFPALAGRASDAVFPLLIQRHLGPFAQGLALASILAAVMSTLDAQMLTLSSMLTRDVLRNVRGDRQQIFLGRSFLVVLAAITWIIAIRKPASIFSIAALSFSGYVTLIPTMFLSMRWPSFSRAAATCSIVVGNLALVTSHTWGPKDALLLPVAWALLGGTMAAVFTTLLFPRRTRDTNTTDG